MKICDMCGRKKPNASVTISEHFTFTTREKEYEICAACAERMKKFIRFAYARQARRTDHAE